MVFGDLGFSLVKNSWGFFYFLEGDENWEMGPNPCMMYDVSMLLGSEGKCIY